MTIHKDDCNYPYWERTIDNHNSMDESIEVRPDGIYYGKRVPYTDNFNMKKETPFKHCPFCGVEIEGEQE